MTEKDLKRIRRKDLKEMLVFQSEKAERLQQRINEFESKKLTPFSLVKMT